MATVVPIRCRHHQSSWGCRNAIHFSEAIRATAQTHRTISASRDWPGRPIGSGRRNTRSTSPDVRPAGRSRPANRMRIKGRVMTLGSRRPISRGGRRRKASIRMLLARSGTPLRPRNGQAPSSVGNPPGAWSAKPARWRARARTWVVAHQLEVCRPARPGRPSKRATADGVVRCLRAAAELPPSRHRGERNRTVRGNYRYRRCVISAQPADGFSCVSHPATSHRKAIEEGLLDHFSISAGMVLRLLGGLFRIGAGCFLAISAGGDLRSRQTTLAQNYPLRDN